MAVDGYVVHHANLNQERVRLTAFWRHICRLNVKSIAVCLNRKVGTTPLQAAHALSVHDANSFSYAMVHHGVVS